MKIVDKKASEHPAAGGTVMRPIAKLAKRKKPPPPPRDRPEPRQK
ncbi:MAG: hypothetical protein ACRDLL_17455 [Solirubrobacterales bacterium]